MSAEELKESKKALRAVTETYAFVKRLYDQTIPERTLMALNEKDYNYGIKCVIDDMERNFAGFEDEVRFRISEYVNTVFNEAKRNTNLNILSSKEMSISYNNIDDEMSITTFNNKLIVTGSLIEKVKKLLNYDLYTYMENICNIKYKDCEEENLKPYFEIITL